MSCPFVNKCFARYSDLELEKAISGSMCASDDPDLYGLCNKCKDYRVQNDASPKPEVPLSVFARMRKHLQF